MVSLMTGVDTAHKITPCCLCLNISPITIGIRTNDRAFSLGMGSRPQSQSSPAFSLLLVAGFKDKQEEGMCACVHLCTCDVCVHAHELVVWLYGFSGKRVEHGGMQKSHFLEVQPQFPHP